MPKNKKLGLNSVIQTNQILTKDAEVCIPRLSSILLAILGLLHILNCQALLQLLYLLALS